VEIDGKEEVVHVKNTGRCKELLVPGAVVVLEIAENPNRKTKYDLIAVYKEGVGLINMDSQAPNQVVGEWLAGENPLFPGISLLKPEFTYGQSRIDFYFEYQEKKVLLEVKGVTLERDGVCYFPDAPTERGVKHIRELAAAALLGYECYIAFVIQMEGVDCVYPNRETHPEFGEALEEALRGGVRVLWLGCSVGEDTLRIDRQKMLFDSRDICV
jgi:sugar fermentation stimulation protein A